MASNLQSPQGSIAGLEATIGYRFVQPGIAQEALHAPGLAVVTGSSVQRFRNWPMLMAGNKRLAILGDTILQLVLVEDWYGTTLEKGSCSAILREVSSNENLDRVGRLHGIDRFVNKNPSQGNEVPFNIMTATVEAILGAVWLDSQHDLDAVRRVMGTLGLVPAGITSAISSASQS